MKSRLTISDNRMSGFLSRHQLPPGFPVTAERHYLPLARRLPEYRGARSQLVVGINGAPGTGKSTLAEYFRLATESMFDWNVAVLSIDDFYYTLTQRRGLAKEVHPLLATRGVPGTHDTDMLARCLERLRHAGSAERVSLPRFDKAIDNRADESRWPVVEGPVDLVILEGWCVGTEAQLDAELAVPVNDLEHFEDVDGTWRRYVNDQLKVEYASIFAQLDMLVYIRAPSFDAILRWRLEQEDKLAEVSPANSTGLMNGDQINRFIQFYERLIRASMVTLESKSDVVFKLNETHSIKE